MKNRSAVAVIGALYGDEGKGGAVDYLASLAAAPVTVVRTNGGAQAGHTVVTDEGVRHVFHHVGSGAFAGAATHFSRRFVSHPMFLSGEIDEVAAKGGRVDSFSADPRGYVTTPWDIMVNQVIEQRRGNDRHGSCGFGLGETVGRNEETPYGLTVADLVRPDLVHRLVDIRRLWLPGRLQALGLGELSSKEKEMVFSDGVMTHFLADCRAFAQIVRLVPDGEIAGPVIMEGAQGLLLDQDYGAFPHVTRSNTGLVNMIEFAREAGIGRIEAFFGCRTYTSRHGAGPLAHEGELGAGIDFVDETNVENAWQGRIRLAPLDVGVFVDAVLHDLLRAAGQGVKVVPSIWVSCLDQIRDGWFFVDVSGARNGDLTALIDGLQAAVGADRVMTTSGVRRSDRSIYQAEPANLPSRIAGVMSA